MKSTILKYTLAAAVLLPLGASAQRFHHRTPKARKDTVITFSNPAKIVIIEDEKVSSKASYDHGELAIRLAGTDSHNWSLVTGGLGFGLDGAVNQPDGADLQMGKSFEVLWLKALNARYKFDRHAISFGLGFDWRNFKMTGAPKRMTPRPFGGIMLEEYPYGTTPLNSTLKIFSLAVPVLYSYTIPDLQTKFSVGPVINFNTYSSLKTSYINREGNKTTEFVKGLGQRPVSFDIFGSVSWNCVGLYIKGSPLKALKSYSDLNFNPLTVGIIFFM